MPWEDGSTVRHGTPSGAQKHVKLGEDPCVRCAVAKAAYDRRRRKAPDVLKDQRARAAARQAALGRLASLYPGTMASYYVEELGKRGLKPAKPPYNPYAAESADA